MKKNILLLFVLAASLCSYAQNNASTVKVTLQNNGFTHADLVNAYGNERKVYASTDIKDNTFTLKLNIPNDIYRFDFGDENYFLVVITPGENMELTIDAQDLLQIVSVTNSPSMSFVQDIIDNDRRKSEIIDSLNSSLQTDHEQRYWSKLTQEVTNFKQACQETDNYVLAAYASVDSLNSLFREYAPGGKVKSGNADVFVSSVSKFMKEMENNYRPFSSYRENSEMFAYYTQSGRSEGHDEYFAMLDNYVAEAESRYSAAEKTLGNCMSAVTELLDRKDSLSYSNLFDKKGNKTAWCTDAVNRLAPLLKTAAGAHSSFATSAALQKAAGNTIVSEAQQNVKAIVNRYQTAYNDAENSLNGQNKQYIMDNKSDIAVMMFLDLYPKEQNAELHKAVITALHEKYPEHPIVKERWKIMNSPANKTAIGAMAPELAFKDPDGNVRKLSDLKGKIVLIDFWASWCGPCRRENPNVRNIYAKYHDQGFEIYSVSLDRDAANWKKAIADDGLVWPNHVSDLKQWQSEGAAIYGVRSIPSTFLLDREGRIVAKDLRGSALENAVKELIAR